MMDQPQSVLVANSRALQITRMTCPVRIALHIRFGPVMLDTFALAVMSGTDDAVILGGPTLDIVGLDIYAGLTECNPRKVERRARPVKRTRCVACPRLSLSVAAMQQQPIDDIHDAGRTVECVVERGEVTYFVTFQTRELHMHCCLPFPAVWANDSPAIVLRQGNV